MTNDISGMNVPQIQTKIASVQDTTYPASENTEPANQINVAFRDTGFVRHEPLGLNAFLLEMFNQFNDVLGVRTDDYMSGSPNDLPNAIANVVQQARNQTALVEIPSVSNGSEWTRRSR